MEIIIKIEKDQIYFNPDHSISFSNTNLPESDMSFRCQGDIYWKIELIEYKNEIQCWNVKVLDYYVSDFDSFSKQRSTRPIKKLNFEKLDWEKLEPQLMSYKIINLHDILINYTSNPPKSIEAYDIYDYKNNHPETPITVTYEPIIVPIPKIEPETNSKIPLKEILKFTFTIGLEDVTFNDGFVSFTKFVKQIGKQINFDINNAYVLKEFDNIKGWFSKRLKVNRIKVSAEITILDEQVTNIKVSSEQISLITPELIENVKQQRTLALTKPPKSSRSDKGIYTSDEIFKLLDLTHQEGNIFNQTDNEIINVLVKSRSTRNRIQLEYLSQTKQTTKSKIHYTLNPLFGFLFTVEGSENYHFVWELLNSHATYIWTIERTDKEINILFKSVEDIINKIREIGRDEYKKTYRERKDLGFIFNVIDHDIITKSINMGFIKWETKLNELLR